MNPREFAHDLLHDDLAARQQVKDARREAFSWSDAPRLDEAPYAAVVSLLAERQGNRPPAWTRDVPPSPEPVYLMGRGSAVLQKAVRERAPQTLKRWNVFATPEYLDVL